MWMRTAGHFMFPDPSVMTERREYGALRDASSEERLFYQERRTPLKHRLDPGHSLLRRLRRKYPAAALSAAMKRGSLSLETVAALPLFLFAVLTIISFQEIYSTQAVQLTLACTEAMETGLSSDEDEITISQAYSFRPACMFFCPAVPMENQVTVHAWSGADYGTMTAGIPDETDEHMVYVTEHGSVVHEDAHCSYLDLSVSCVSGSSVESLRNVYGSKYHPCEICSHSGNSGGAVYITEKGDRYHCLGSCSGLKRTVRLVKQSETGEMKTCSRCGGHDHAGDSR